MTQDDLRAALLLMGFTTGSITRYWRRYTNDKVISIIFKEYDVVVYYRSPANDPIETKEFMAPPQTVFDFIKEKLT